MKIKCPVIREGGSFVEVFGTEYHFAPQLDGCHVADVENAEHQDRLLSIGYSIYRGYSAPEKELSFENLAGLNVAEMSDDDLRRFATEVMGISPKNKAPIIEWHSKAFADSEPLDQALSVVELLRQCAHAIVESEKKAATSA